MPQQPPPLPTQQPPSAEPLPPPPAAEGTREEMLQRARARLAETHGQLVQQQQMLTLDHHLVWKMQGMLARMHRELEVPASHAASSTAAEEASPANRTADSW